MIAVAGCRARQNPEKVAQQLQESFQKSDAAITADIVQAGTAIKASNYTDAILIVDRVVQRQPIDATQKKAVDALIIQAREAIDRNPKLDSPQLYQALSDLLTRVHGEN
jgi:hypothetical protein